MSSMTTGQSSPPSLSAATGTNEGRLLAISCYSRFPSPPSKPANPCRWTWVKLCGVMLVLPPGIALDDCLIRVGCMTFKLLFILDFC